MNACCSLVNFFDGCDLVRNELCAESKGAKAGKNKKKNRKKKPHAKESSNNDNGECKEADGPPHPCENGTDIDGLESASNLDSQLLDPMSPFSTKIDFDDGDIDDELDPAMKEELDREVEDFARRLNSDWPERMQEILSLGQGRRLTSLSLSSNGSAQRYTGIGLHVLAIIHQRCKLGVKSFSSD
ncbi:hypothetical protein Cgig2_010613 [Carnegiea gigantea]|uniref:Uncharacterized protein n=1 Tax=Carnegiea gigantea TaxID=171969 RepID=A0A9Q1QP85_9CARY|nr:hypothetical protein Cgig2_010613 [Carnegiea gigantea]